MGIGDINVGAPLEAYHNVAGKRPWLNSLLMGSGLAAGGYYGAQKLLPRGGRFGVSDPKNRRDVALRIAALLGTAGAAYPLLTGLDTSGKGSAVGSLTDPDYWDKHPETSKADYDRTQKSIAGDTWDYEDMDFTRGAGMEKEYAWDAPYMGERIPASVAMDLLGNDRYLDNSQKSLTVGILNDAEEGRSGLISGKDITRSAVRAGVGYGAAYLFGNTMGKVFGLPTPVTKQLSHFGGLAGAVINTGIFK